MYIKEIFYSFQGEGPWVGYPQIFIRFYGCNIHCAYCDEPDYVEDRQNYTVEKVLEELKAYKDLPVHSVSITGGEPLIQVQAIKDLLPQLPYPAYLETNATLPKNLDEVKDLFTYFSVDYKHGFQKEFAEFLEKIKDKPNVFIKYVLVEDFPVEDMQEIIRIMSQINPNMPLVIQPVTPFAEVKTKASPETISLAFSMATKVLNDVRIIPQTHKFIGVR